MAMDDSKKILEAMLVPTKTMIYAIGCFEQRITIYSQQIRAFNLAFALIKENKLTEGKDVGIIGGGIAGITVAAAIASHGFKVTLFEKASKLCYLQRGESNRYIHPNIYDWPSDESTNPQTELPFLNWKADVSREIIKSLDKEFENFATGITIKTEAEVAEIIEKPDHVKVILTRQMDREFEFSMVIFAGGFGIEKNALTKDPLNSYWRSESLHQERLRNHEKPDVFIAGTGDGGLIDTQRAIISDFDHGSLINTIIGNSDFIKISRQIAALEKDIYALTDIDEQSQMLEKIYGEIKFPNDLTGFFSESRRKDLGPVTLYGNTPTLLTLKTSLLNRIVVYILHRKGYINYQPTPLRRKEAKKAIKANHIVIERCGTEPTWIPFFNSLPDFGTRVKIQQAKLRELNPGQQKYWPANGKFFRKKVVMREQKIIVILKNQQHRNTDAILAAFDTEVKRVKDEKDIDLILHTFEFDPRNTQDADNRKKITGIINKMNPEIVIVANSDLVKYCDVLERPKHLILSGESGILSDVYHQRKEQYPKQGLISVKQPVSLENIVEFLNAGFAGKNIGFIYDDDYEVDKLYVQSMQQSLSKVDPGSRISLIPILAGREMKRCEFYIGRYYLHANIAAHPGIPIASCYNTDKEKGAIILYDVEPHSTADLMIKGLRLIMDRKDSVLHHGFTVKTPLFYLEEGPLSQYGITYPEELLERTDVYDRFKGNKK